MTQTIADNDFLLVIDVQNDFLPGGTLGIDGADVIIPVINDVAKKFDRVVMAQDWHPADHISFASQHPGALPWDVVETDYGPQLAFPDHCVQNTWGAAFHENLDVPHAETILRKGVLRTVDSNSAFYGNDDTTPTGLAGYLKDREAGKVYVAGLAMDVCVLRTAVHAAELGYEVSIIEDASKAAYFEDSYEKALASMAEKGIRFVQSADLMRA